jgi:diaminopimelate epimerase
MTTIPFTKMVGTGNDFVVVDAIRNRLSKLRGRWPRIARVVCDRHHGVGADGVLLLEPSKTADVRMRIFNADGSEVQMCGNGARCVARFVSGANGKHPGTVRIETLAGTVSAQVAGSRVRVKMPLPKDLRTQLNVRLSDGSQIRGGSVNTGVPHFVVPVKNIDAVDVQRLGRLLRYHPVFGPKGTNVNFIQEARRPLRLRVRTYERGVEAQTLACGTGMTASAIIHGLRQGAAGSSKHCRIAVQPASGDRLMISFLIAGGSGRPVVTDVVMEGSAHAVYDGRWEVSRR